MAEVADVAGHGLEDLLAHVVGILTGDAAQAAPALDERPIEAEQPLPGFFVAVLDALQQGGRSRFVLHGGGPPGAGSPPTDTYRSRATP